MSLYYHPNSKLTPVLVQVTYSPTQVEMLKRRVAELEEENRRLHAQARAMQEMGVGVTELIRTTKEM